MRDWLSVSTGKWHHVKPPRQPYEGYLDKHVGTMLHMRARGCTNSDIMHWLIKVHPELRGERSIRTLRTMVAYVLKKHHA